MNDAIDLFLAASETHSSRAAIRCGSASVSYARLADRVRRIARITAEIGQPRALIALAQGADAYAAIFGVAMGGGCYAPINLSSPREKMERIVRAFKPNLVIAAPDAADALLADAPGARWLNLDELDAIPPLAGRGLRSERAYVIFTSGSTGQPKGVVISRSALNHYVTWLVEDLGLSPDDVVSQHPNLAFDLSVMDTYGALCCGATLCPITSQGDRLMPARAIARERISVWISVPSVIGLMARAGQADSANLYSVRLFVFCGEPLLQEHLQTIFAARPDALVVNTYGPTETTVSVTYLPLTSTNYEHREGRSVAIGAPIRDMDIRLVGGPHSDEGEIVITGPQLADGYWEDPEQTQRAFRTLAVEGRTVRAYFTGDWAERVSGRIHFRNRIDFQVKVNGFRLELDEVAAAVRSLGWPEACVTTWRGKIVAFVECGDDRSLDESALRSALSRKLEAHAVPARIIGLPALPRNENDKVDRAALAQRLEFLTFK